MSAEVESLEAEMNDLLAALADPDSKTVDALWARCREKEQRLREALQARLPVDEQERADLRAGLQRLLRLNLVARQAVLSSQEAVAEELTDTKQGTQTLKAYDGRVQETGGTCDYAG